MSGQRLVPEVRMDKNGRQVTRHVKADHSASQRRKLPAPAMTKEDRIRERNLRERQTEKLKDSLADLHRLGIYVMSLTEAQHNVHHLLKEAPNVMKLLIQHLEGASSLEKSIWEHQIGYVQQFPANWEDKTDYVSPYMVHMELNPLAATMGAGQPPTTSAVHYCTSLTHFATETATKHGREGDYEWMRAVMVVADTLSKSTGSDRRKVDLDAADGDIRFLMENWDRVEPLIPLLVRRNDASRGFIEEVMSSNAPALNEGLL